MTSGGSHGPTWCKSPAWVFCVLVLHRRLDASQPFLEAGGQQAAFKTFPAHIHCERLFLQSKLSTDTFLLLWQLSQSQGIFSQSLLTRFSFNSIKQLLLLLPAFKTAPLQAGNLRIFPLVAKH